MKATIEFELPEEREEHLMSLNGVKAQITIEEIWNECFRPHFKHGYENEKLNKLLEKLGDDGSMLIEFLADIYNQTVRENME